jgi:hypothetical protein
MNTRVHVSTFCMPCKYSGKVITARWYWGFIDVFVGGNDDCIFFMALSIKRETFLIDVFKKCYLLFIQREAKNTSFQLFVQQSEVLQYNYTIYKFQFTVSVIQKCIFIELFSFSRSLKLTTYF